MQPQQTWPYMFTYKQPLAYVYSPFPQQRDESFMNPFIGYPNCPLIGRYNQGEYRIAQTKCHFQFNTMFDHQSQQYKCGSNAIHLPQKIVYNIRNIPEVIKHNKPPNQPKNSKINDFHPMKFPVREQMTFIFMVTMGEIGKDFLNYLNHMYTLGHQFFIQEKLRRSVYLLPIYAYLPQKSGIMEEEVDKGLSLENYRSEYLSLHLKYGAPAFSPNNMRLGIQGMKKVISNPPAKKKVKNSNQNKDKQSSLDQFFNKGQKGNHQKFKKEQKQIEQQKQNEQKKEKDKTNEYNQKQNQLQQEKQSKGDKDKIQVNQNDNTQKKQRIEQKHQVQQWDLDWNQIQQQIQKQKQFSNKQQNQQKQKQSILTDQKPHKKVQQAKPPTKHKGFVHFYTSVLLQNDYRVYYHWHIENYQRKELIYNSLISSKSVHQFLINCRNVLGYQDQCALEAFKLFGIKD